MSSGPWRHSMAKRREVAQLAAVGLTYRAIARRCAVSASTIKNWMGQEQFQRMVEDYQKRDGAYVVRALRGMRKQAIDTLRKIVAGVYQSRSGTPARVAADTAMWLLQHDMYQAYLEVGADEIEIRIIIEHEAVDEDQA